MDALGNIGAINVEIGLSRFAGMENAYVEMMEIFYRKLAGERDALQGFLAANDLHSFAISVHSIKSSLSTLGVMGLSDIANGLEGAAKNADGAYCEQHFPKLLAGLNELYGSLAAVFPDDEDDMAVKLAGDRAFLWDKVQGALKAADDFDTDAALLEVDEALGFDFGAEINETLLRAKRALGEFDVDGAAELLRGIEFKDS
jgi:HPt (histidine-containing phosphotransfer) domain-containing protein